MGYHSKQILTVAELAEAGFKDLARELKKSRIDPEKEINRAIEKHGLTRKKAALLFWRSQGCTLEQCARFAGLGTAKTPVKQLAPLAAANIKQSKVDPANNNIFRRYQRRYGNNLIIDRASVVSDLEVIKQKAFADQQFAAATRATELQARAAGVSMAETILIETDRVPDHDLIQSIAGTDATLAAALAARLGAVDGEWTCVNLVTEQGPGTDQSTPPDQRQLPHQEQDQEQS